MRGENVIYTALSHFAEMGRLGLLGKGGIESRNGGTRGTGRRPKRGRKEKSLSSLSHPATGCVLSKKIRQKPMRNKKGKRNVEGGGGS